MMPSASGTRISACSAAVGWAAICACSGAAASAQSGCVRNARTASGISTVTSMSVR